MNSVKKGYLLAGNIKIRKKNKNITRHSILECLFLSAISKMVHLSTFYTLLILFQVYLCIHLNYKPICIQCLHFAF